MLHGSAYWGGFTDNMGVNKEKSMTAKLRESKGANASPSEEMQRLATDWTRGSGRFRAVSKPGMEIDPKSDVGKYNEWLKQGSYEGTLYRGLGISNSDFNKLEPGYEFNQDGISSWSKDISAGAEFALMSRNDKKVLFEMRNGTSGGQDISNYSEMPWEQEVCVSNASWQKVVDVSECTINGEQAYRVVVDEIRR